MEIFDLNGKLIHSQSQVRNHEQIQLPVMAKGIYFIVLKNDTDITTQKIVRQ